MRADVWTLRVLIVSEENALWWKQTLKKQGRLLPPESKDVNTDEALTMHVCKQLYSLPVSTRERRAQDRKQGRESEAAL